MDPDTKKFGSGPRELTGAIDLSSHFKLLPHHDFFCKKSLPVSIADTHYLHNVVGDTEIRKVKGMQLDQLMQNNSQPRDGSILIQPFDLDLLREAFQLKETPLVELPVISSEKGTPTTAGKSKTESNKKERKHKKRKDKDTNKDIEYKKRKHRHSKDKDRSKDKDKDKKKDKSGHHKSNPNHSRKHHEKKRKHDGDEDLNDVHRHKKSKHKSSKIDEIGAFKVAG